MSKLLKSKFLLGALVATVMLVGVVAFKATDASAASCTITTTLRVGSKGAQVACLQAALDNGLKPDGVFGPKTKAEVVAFQAAHSLTADGVFGPMSRAAWMNGGVSMTTYPAGCTSSTGFSPTTGQPCSGTVVTTTFPAGCTSSTGFSSTTGASCVTGVVTSNPTGPLTVSLAADNPAAGNLIQGQATADLAHYTFTGTGTLTQVVLQRSGISDNSIFPNVYLYNGNTRLTDSASVNSQGQIIFNGLNLVVSGSMTVSVRADITPSTAVSESTVMVTLTSYTVSGGTAVTVNIPGNSFFVNSGVGVLSTVALGATNSVALQSLSAGTTQTSLWSDSVNVSLHAVWLKSAAFDVIGSAPSNALANLGLFANGVKISTGTMNGSYINFDLSAAPYSMATGATTLEVRGDIVNGSSRNLQLSVQHASDLMVTDSQVGVNVGVTTQGTSPATFQIQSAGLITILQGSVVAQSDPVFNSTTNVTGGAANVAIASYKLTSYGEDVKVNTVTVTPTITPSTVAACQTSSSSTGLQNVTLYYNGAPVGSSLQGTLSSNCVFNTLTFTPGSNLTIAGGTSGIFQIHADLINGAGVTYASGTIGATVAITQYQGVTSGQTGSLSLSGSNTMNIQTGTLTVAQNANFLSQTVNPNASQQKIGSFILQNQSTSEAVDVNSLNVGFYTNGTLSTPITTTPPVTNFSTLTLGGFPGAVTPIGQPAATGNVFSTPGLQIPAGGSQEVDVYANLGSTNSGSFVTSLLPTAVGHMSRVTITSSAVAGQVISLGVGTVANPTLISNGSTAIQFIPTGGTTGAPNAAQESYNFVATNGTANIVGLKFAALTGVSTTPTSTAVSQFNATGNTASILVGSSASFNVGDNVLVTTTGTFGGTNAVGTVVSKADGTHMLLNLTTAMVAGFSDSGLTTPGVASTIYQLATSGVTSVALNSPGVATGTASFSGGVAYLSSITGATAGTTGAFVPNTPSGVTLPVFMSFGPVNTNGGVTSGSTGQILLEYVQYQTGSSTSYLAPSVAGTTLKLVGSMPTMTLSSANNSLSNGTSVLIGTLTVSANSSGDVSLAKVPLVINVSVGNGGSGTISSGANVVTLTDTNGVALANFNSLALGSPSAGEYAQVFGSAQANHYRITAGQSKTFEIHANLSGFTFGSSASVSVNLGSAAHFVWDDINGNNISNVSTAGVVTTSTTPPTLYGDGTQGSETGGIWSYPSTSALIHN